MKKALSIVIAAFISPAAWSQDTTKVPKDTAWKTGGIFGVNFAQSSYTNWAAGGENSFSVTALFNAFANYKKGKNSWETVIDLAYGKIQVGSVRTLRKSDDKIDLSSKYGRQAFSKIWFYSVLFNFKSQFDEGYNYPNDTVIASRFMAPGYILLALGLDYKPKDYFSLFISPVTARTVVVNDPVLADKGAFGLPKASYDSAGNLTAHAPTVLQELGGYIKLTFKKEVMKNVTLGTKLELFSNYLRNPQNVVVNWETLVNMKVNTHLAVNLNTYLIYDDNILIKVDQNSYGPRVQFKEVLAVGLSWKF